MSQDAAAIRDLRRSLNSESRASLLQIIDETLELMAHIEQRLRYLEQQNEETD